MKLNEIAAPEYEWKVVKGNRGGLQLSLSKNGEYAAEFVYKVGKSNEYSQDALGKWEYSATSIGREYNDPVNDANNSVSFGTNRRAFNSFEELDSFLQRRGRPSIAPFKEQLEGHRTMDITLHNFSDFVVSVDMSVLEANVSKFQNAREFIEAVRRHVTRSPDIKIVKASQDELKKFWEENK